MKKYPLFYSHRDIIYDICLRYNRNSNVYLEFCIYNHTLPITKSKIYELTKYFRDHFISKNELYNIWIDMDINGDSIQRLHENETVIETIRINPNKDIANTMNMLDSKRTNYDKSIFSPKYQNILYILFDDNEETIKDTWIVFMVHHLCLDGVSNVNCVRQMEMVFLEQHNIKLSYIPSINYILDQEFKLPIDRESMKDYLKNLSGQSLDIITDRPITDKRCWNGSATYWKCSTTLSSNIMKYRKRHRLTKFMTLFSFVSILLRNFSSHNTFGIASHINYRDWFEKYVPSGCHVLTTIYKFDKDIYNLTEWISNLKDTYNFLSKLLCPLYMIENSSSPVGQRTYAQYLVHYGFEEFTHYSIDITKMLETIQTVPYLFENGYYDIFFSLLQISKDELAFEVRFTDDLYNTNTIERLTRRLVHIVSQLIETPEKENDLNIIDIYLEEEHSIYHSLKYNNEDYGNYQTIQEIFQSRETKYLDRIALRLDDQEMTYEEFYKEVYRCSNYLFHTYHFSPDDVVCVCMSRSILFIIVLFSLFCCGVTYCPVPINEADERLLKITKRIRPILLITDSTLSLSEKIECLCIHIQEKDYANYPETFKVITSENAYISHTSGSTGEPKGAVIKQESFYNLYNSLLKYNWYQESSSMLQFSSIGFDVHIQEILPTLLNGHTLILLHLKRERDLSYIRQVIKHSHVESMILTPSIFSAMTETKDCKEDLCNVKTFLFIGEPYQEEHTASIFYINPHSTIVNLFGPVEQTVSMTFHSFTKDTIPDAVTIGRPYPNVSCQVLINSRHACLYEPGELYVGGVQTLKEYRNNEEQTRKAFSFDMMYKTGDIVKINEKGDMIYIGRKDGQIKINGQRIEVQEIERVIETMESVDSCRIIKDNYQNTNESILVAYVKTLSQLNEEEIRYWCLKRLPSYMNPSVYVFIDDWPINENGKINWKMLPRPSYNLVEDLAQETVSDLETKLCLIYSSVLSVTIRVTTPLKSIAISSMSLIRIQNIIYQKLNYYIVTECMRYALTIKDIACYCQDRILIDPIPVSNKQIGPLSRSQQSIYLHEAFGFVPKSPVYTTNYLFKVSRFLESDIKHLYLTLLYNYPCFRTRFLSHKTQEIISHETLVPNFIVIESLKDLEESSRYFSYISLKDSPLLRFYYSRDGHLLFQIHHILYDHHCDQILYDIMLAILNKNKKLPYQTNHITMIDYALYETNTIQYDQDAKLFWENELDPSYAFVSILPTKQYLKKRKGAETMTFSWTIPKELCDRIFDIVTVYNTTLYICLLSLFSKFICDHLQIPVCYIGGEYLNLLHPDCSSLLGYLMTFVTYKSEDIYKNDKSLFQGWNEKVLKTHKYSSYPFSKLHSFPSSKGIPFCSIVFTELPSNPLEIIQTENGSLELIHTVRSLSIFPLMHFIRNTKCGIELIMIADPEIYDESVIKSVFDKWTQYLLLKVPCIDT
jgi:amino acid adenylation domain-containing protein